MGLIELMPYPQKLVSGSMAALFVNLCYCRFIEKVKTIDGSIEDIAVLLFVLSVFDFKLYDTIDFNLYSLVFILFNIFYLLILIYIFSYFTPFSIHRLLPYKEVVLTFLQFSLAFITYFFIIKIQDVAGVSWVWLIWLFIIVFLVLLKTEWVG